MQWRPLNVSLLPLKSTLVKSCFICFSGDTKPVFWDCMQMTFWYKTEHLARPWFEYTAGTRNALSAVYYKTEQILTDVTVAHSENALSHLSVLWILFFWTAWASYAAIAECHDSPLGGVAASSTKYNISLKKKMRWALMWCNGNCILWVSTVFSMHCVWAVRDACHEYNSLIVQRCSGWICLTATVHTPQSSFYYGRWLQDLAPA